MTFLISNLPFSNQTFKDSNVSFGKQVTKSNMPSIIRKINYLAWILKQILLTISLTENHFFLKKINYVMITSEDIILIMNY